MTWAGLVGLSLHQKLTSALRMLAYGTLADQLDDLTRMAESTTLHNLKVFCNSIISRYGTEYLRAPTKDDMEMVLRLHERSKVMARTSWFIGCDAVGVEELSQGTQRSVSRKRWSGYCCFGSCS